MYLGALSSIFIRRPLREAAQRMHELGLQFIEIGAGGFFPKNHCDPARLLLDKGASEVFQQTLSDSSLAISAFALHGEPLHPDPEIACGYDQDFRAACAFAGKIGVTRLTLLAGLPEAVPGDKMPNWILYPFPARNMDLYRWQWEQRLIPYWKEHAQIAQDHGVRLCFEMHPADMVFKPEALLRLRDAIGPVVGCNLDPSHLFWQGMDVLEVVRVLKGTIYHAHAKDSRPDPHNVRVNGILDAKDFRCTEERSWLFRTVGYGHSEAFWRDFVTELRVAGYDDVLSIEHEDPLIDPEEGFELAVGVLQKLLIRKPSSLLWYEQ
jgi:sugar phosphate isomerase/epimerase